MRRFLLVLPAMIVAGAAAAQSGGGNEAVDPKAKAPPLQYRSALEDYRPFAEPELANWRRSNDEVGAAGGHGGTLPGQGTGEQSSKPQPGAPESTGAGDPQHHRGHRGHR